MVDPHIVKLHRKMLLHVRPVQPNRARRDNAGRFIDAMISETRAGNQSVVFIQGMFHDNPMTRVDSDHFADGFTIG